MHILDNNGDERYDGMATEYMHSIALKHLDVIQFLTVAQMCDEEVQQMTDAAAFVGE